MYGQQQGYGDQPQQQGYGDQQYGQSYDQTAYSQPQTHSENSYGGVSGVSGVSNHATCHDSKERPPHPAICWGFDGRLVVALPNTTVAVVGTSAPPPLKIIPVCFPWIWILFTISSYFQNLLFDVNFTVAGL